MTMEDITLNIFVPTDNKESKRKLKEKVNIKQRKKTNVCDNNVKKKRTKLISEDISERKGKIVEKVSIFNKIGVSDNKSVKKKQQKVNNENSLYKKGKVEKKISIKQVNKSDSSVNKIVKEKKTKISEETSGVSKNQMCIPLLLQNDTKPVDEKENNDDIGPIYEPVFSAKTFKSIDSLHPHLVANLEQQFGITIMTVVQQITIPVLLSRNDALVRSQTGSGKTLAYAVPIINFLQDIRPKVSRSDGVKVLVVLPTRELALQTYECFLKLSRSFTWLVPGLLVGGEKRKSEKARLRKGITILIGTPGRLIDHTKHTSVLSLKNVQWLVIDEADKLLDLGYEEAISSLLDVLKQEKYNESECHVQTVLLSATLTPGVERLAGLALDSPTRLDASNTNDLESDSTALVIPHTLDQCYITVTAKLRLVLLSAVLIHHTQLEKTDKILIFMATQDMVDYYADLLTNILQKRVPFFKLHGSMTQIERKEVFQKFRNLASGVLLCTDVGARGLDLPKTDVIVQYNAPNTPADYVHRVGRTARVGFSGSSILFLDPAELNFLQWLNNKRIKLKEKNTEEYLNNLVENDQKNKKWGGGIEGAATAVQLKFEHALLDDEKLHEIACQAYKSWVRFYASYPKEARTVFSFKSLHLGHHAKSFALRDPPSTIGGIGKPSFLQNKHRVERKRKNNDEKLKVETTSERTKRLIISEFDSGINFKRKK